MRGLKHSFGTLALTTLWSHLLQMRGLKRYDALNMPEYLGSHLLQMRGLKLVLVLKSVKKLLVASFTDAWIETREGLFKISSFRVASFTDAWIETGHTRTKDADNRSHLLQMRGLKL